MSMKKDRYTVPQAAKHLGISPQAVLKAIKTGRLQGQMKTIQVPKKVWFISPKSIDKYVVSASHQERGLKNP